MQALRRVLSAVLWLCIFLTACSPISTISPSTPTPIPPSPQPSLPPTAPIPTSEPNSLGIPVIKYIDQQNTLSVISSVTGKPFDQFIPIPLATYYNYAFSPDKKTLAI